MSTVFTKQQLLQFDCASFKAISFDHQCDVLKAVAETLSQETINQGSDYLRLLHKFNDLSKVQLDELRSQNDMYRMEHYVTATV